jgi:hypothetical protein
MRSWYTTVGRDERNAIRACYGGWALDALYFQLYPTSARRSDQGFSYNCGRACGAVFPALAGLLSSSMTLGHAIGVFAGSAYGLLVLSDYCLFAGNQGKGAQRSGIHHLQGGGHSTRFTRASSAFALLA